MIAVCRDDSGGIQQSDEINDILAATNHFLDWRNPEGFLKTRQRHAVEEVTVQNKCIDAVGVVGKGVEREVEGVVQIRDTEYAFPDFRFLIVVEFLVFHAAPEVLVADPPRVFGFAQSGFLVKDVRDTITVDAVLSRVRVESECEVVECLVRTAGQLGSLVIRHQDPRCTRR